MMTKDAKPTDKPYDIELQELKNGLIRQARYFKGRDNSLDRWFDRTLAIVEQVEKQVLARKTSRPARNTRQD
jgi:hypothetical protein